jgi:hypothetical protein
MDNAMHMKSASLLIIFCVPEYRLKPKMLARLLLHEIEWAAEDHHTEHSQIIILKNISLLLSGKYSGFRR